MKETAVLLISQSGKGRQSIPNLLRAWMLITPPSWSGLLSLLERPEQVNRLFYAQDGAEFLLSQEGLSWPLIPLMDSLTKLYSDTNLNLVIAQ